MIHTVAHQFGIGVIHIPTDGNVPELLFDTKSACAKDH